MSGIRVESMLSVLSLAMLRLCNRRPTNKSQKGNQSTLTVNYLHVETYCENDCALSYLDRFGNVVETVYK